MSRRRGGPFTLRATPPIVMAAQKRIAEETLAREIALAKQEAAFAPLFRPGPDEVERFLNNQRNHK